MKITKRCLRRMIREAVQGYIDGYPFPGSLEDLAQCHGQFWGHGSVVDPADWKENIKQGGLYTVGKALSPLKRKTGKLSEKQLRRIVREATADRSKMPAREFQEHPLWEPIQHSQWLAEQVSDDRNLQVEVEWEDGGRDVITLPPDVVADFDEEIETDRWAVDAVS